MKLSKEAQFIIERCFDGETTMTVRPMFNTKYTYKDKEYKFTESVLEEVLKSGCVKELSREEKFVNLMGIEGMHLDVSS